MNMMQSVAAIARRKANAGGGPVLGTSWVTGISHSSARNDYSGFLGGSFTVGGSNITVNALARWVISGNSASHIVKITDNSGTTVASVTINTSGATPGDWKYEFLGAPVVLTASTLYVIQSEEVNAGDEWYSDASYTVTAVATKGGQRFGSPTWADGGVDNTGLCYIPCNFYYE